MLQAGSDGLCMRRCRGLSLHFKFTYIPPCPWRGAVEAGSLLMVVGRARGVNKYVRTKSYNTPGETLSQYARKRPTRHSLDPRDNVNPSTCIISRGLARSISS